MSETAPPEPAASYSVTFTLSDRVVPCAADTFVLTAALNAGLKLPFVCRRGICGTCKSKLVSGEYDMKHLGGIKPAEIESGLFLPCCSRPRSDLTIEK